MRKTRTSPWWHSTSAGMSAGRSPVAIQRSSSTTVDAARAGIWAGQEATGSSGPAHQRSYTS
ncbi:hypothetical protein [Streptomyces sp. NBC_01314]|uniref:hypothetical protein n=1 Tax=Streptomyces sp. NBC_01314 TaxID=2903821 RepID=UPI003085A324|nr:hypothetical protein OG622_01755 [Streptomyces sp. NBC_01314]